MSAIEQVLFEAPGPRARRNIRVGSVLASVLVVALVVGALWQFGSHGQLAASQWQLFLRRSIVKFFAEGLGQTLKAAGMAALLAVPLALFAAFGRMSRNRAVRLLAGFYVEFLRAVPVLLLLYVFLLLLPRYQINVGTYWMLVIPLALSNSASLAEIFRSGVLSMDKGQFEGGYSVGLRNAQVMRLIIVPQVLRRLAPTLISQIIYLLKGTTLGYVVSYTELLHQAETIGEYHNIAQGINGPLVQSYLVVMLIFVAINASLAKLARVVEASQGARFGKQTVADEVAANA
jgi:glutamate transport system permease protein